MPIDIVTGEKQELINWLFRAFFFAFVGMFIGIFAQSFLNAIKKIKHNRYHDQHTNLPNQSCLELGLDNAIVKINQEEINGFSLLLINIENYIEIYYTFGPEASDDLIQIFINQIKELLDEEILVYQILPNRLAVFTEKNTNLKNNQDNLTTILNGFQSDSVHVDGVPIYADIRIGIASCPEDGTDSKTLLKLAGIALYRAKKDYLQYAEYDGETDWTKNSKLELLGDIPKAIRDNQFKLYYQPKYDICEKKIIGLEALLRWYHPEKGIIGPNNFIAEAEQTALIHSITKWVFTNALEQIVLCDKEGLEVKIAINISSRNLKDPQFTAFMLEQLKAFDIKPERIELEITERELIEETGSSYRILNELAQSGFEIAIDDFGTGDTSLRYLKHIPATTIKIDRSFIENIHLNWREEKIVESMISMATVLGYKVVAEGVEYQEAVDILSKINCNVIQGYVFSKPIPGEELIEKLKLFNVNGKF